jgi:ABC-2 type transport system ATP-binding protein
VTTELNQWVSNLKFEQDNSWHGQLQGNPDDFLARLRQMNVQIIALNLSRPSLEEFFLQQLSATKIANK